MTYYQQASVGAAKDTVETCLLKDFEMTRVPKIELAGLWSKYGLIVVGNIVFFALLYLFSYRPHNAENRAAEFLSLAQLAETKGRNQTAMDLYEKIIDDYAGTRAFETADERFPILKKTLAEAPDCPPPKQTPCEALNLEEMLRKDPGVYIATHLARHFERFPDDRTKIHDIIWKYLKMAHEWGKLPVKQLKGESEFQSKTLQKAFFELKPKCEMTPDWWYDDFYLVNANFYAWQGVSVSVTISQGEASAEAQIRTPKLPSGERLDLTEFRVKKDGGPVTCKLTLKTKDGGITITETL